MYRSTPKRPKTSAPLQRQPCHPNLSKLQRLPKMPKQGAQLQENVWAKKVKRRRLKRLGNRSRRRLMVLLGRRARVLLIRTRYRRRLRESKSWRNHWPKISTKLRSGLSLKLQQDVLQQKSMPNLVCNGLDRLASQLEEMKTAVLQMVKPESSRSAIAPRAKASYSQVAPKESIAVEDQSQGHLIAGNEAIAWSSLLCSRNHDR